MQRINITALYLVLSLLITRGVALAQTNDLKARSSYLNAESSYYKKDYENATKMLYNAKHLLGRTNGKIQYLLVKSLKKNKQFRKAKEELNLYFKVQSEDNSDAKYNEMVQMITTLDNLLAKEEEQGTSEEVELSTGKSSDTESKNNVDSTRESISALFLYSSLFIIGINAYIAHKKGKSVILWIFLSIVLSFLGTIILLALKPNKQLT